MANHSLLGNSPEATTAARLRSTADRAGSAVSSGSLLLPHLGLSAEGQQTNRHNFLRSAHLGALPVHKRYFSLHVLPSLVAIAGAGLMWYNQRTIACCV